MSCLDGAGVIELFANCCEELNEFSRSLRHIRAFGKVRTGADIRNYACGWRLEKYVEADLNTEEGWCAVWWLELGQRNDSWFVESNVSVSHSELYIEFPERTAADTKELKLALEQSVQDLLSSVENEHQFIQEIRALQMPLR